MKVQKKKIVFVGLSGGVDSSVTAALLKKAGHTVVGVFIRTWQPDFIECNFREDRLDAMRIAAVLDIPFLECDAEEKYKHAVAEYMIEEYKLGRTPNPDVMCNREIKFGVFWDFAKARGADYIATGHYAQIRNDAESGGFLLEKAVDPSKDQSYFLYRLTSDDLSHVIFPIGGLHKTAVRKLAQKFHLPTAAKKDSQGICMLGDLDLKQFLGHYIPSVRGDVLSENGEVVGSHDGAIFLTLGERHGFTITKKTPNDERYYIVAKDVSRNTVTVAVSAREGAERPRAQTEYILERTTWVTETPSKEKKYTAQIRYHGELLACTIEIQKQTTAVIRFTEPVLVASGQSIVIYEKNSCLGGGIIHSL